MQEMQADVGSIARLGRSQRRRWQPTLLFLPGESHGQRILVGYSPQGHKELTMAEVTGHAHSELGELSEPSSSTGTGVS